MILTVPPNWSRLGFRSKWSFQALVSYFSLVCKFWNLLAIFRLVFQSIDKFININQNINRLQTCDWSRFHCHSYFILIQLISTISWSTGCLQILQITKNDAIVCNSLFYDLPKCVLKKLQYVQNSAARLIYLFEKFDHITPLLINLQRLPIEQSRKPLQNSSHHDSFA